MEDILDVLPVIPIKGTQVSITIVLPDGSLEKVCFTWDGEQWVKIDCKDLYVPPIKPE